MHNLRKIKRIGDSIKTTQLGKKCAKTLSACILAFFIVNFFFFFYKVDGEWITRDGGATSGVYKPGAYIINFAEGAGGIRVADPNGYLNQSADLGETYVLALGKSHTNAVEVMPNERYVSLLNDKLCQAADKVKVYSVARGGAEFPELLKGVKALTEEFPDSTALIIEMDSIGSVEALRNCLNQRTYNEENDKAEYRMENRTVEGILKGIIKEKLPLVAYFLEVKLEQIDWGFKNAFGIDKRTESIPMREDLTDDYEKALNDAFQMLNDIYDGEIIILYHPTVSVDRSGELIINRMDYYDVMKEQCELNHIFLCDVGDAFLSAYQTHRVVPYGFWNTSMGTGHLNIYGHEIIANTLYESYFNIGGMEK